MTTYDRPVEATLHVHLADGETWEATDEDLERFGLVRRRDAYASVEQALGTALPWRDSLTGSPLNPLRYLVEAAVVFPHLLRQHPGDYAATMRDVARLDVLLERFVEELVRVDDDTVCNLPSADDPGLSCTHPLGHGPMVPDPDDEEQDHLPGEPEPGRVSPSHGASGATWWC